VQSFFCNKYFENQEKCLEKTEQLILEVEKKQQYYLINLDITQKGKETYDDSSPLL